MKEKEELIQELYECVKETLAVYHIKAEMTQGEDTIDIHDRKSDFEGNGVSEDEQGIRIRFKKLEDGYELKIFRVNQQYNVNIEYMRKLISKICDIEM